MRQQNQKLLMYSGLMKNFKSHKLAITKLARTHPTNSLLNIVIDNILNSKPIKIGLLLFIGY